VIAADRARSTTNEPDDAETDGATVVGGELVLVLLVAGDDADGASVGVERRSPPQPVTVATSPPMEHANAARVTRVNSRALRAEPVGTLAVPLRRFESVESSPPVLTTITKSLLHAADALTSNGECTRIEVSKTAYAPYSGIARGGSRPRHRRRCARMTISSCRPAHSSKSVTARNSSRPASGSRYWTDGGNAWLASRRRMRPSSVSRRRFLARMLSCSVSCRCDQPSDALTSRAALKRSV
jgi:hypothetical protein